jgi:transcriptional regulator with XRE-family HTH domain
MKRATIRKPPLDFGGETLGQRLTRLRNQRGYTQVEFAKKVGITQVLVSSYETDRRQFSVEMAIRFALALDISTAWDVPSPRSAVPGVAHALARRRRTGLGKSQSALFSSHRLF